MLPPWFVLLQKRMRREKETWENIKNKMLRTRRRMREGWWWKRNKIERLKERRRGLREGRRWFFHWKRKKRGRNEKKMSLVLMDGSFPLFISPLSFESHLSPFDSFFSPFSSSKGVDSSTHHEWGLSLCTEWINNTEPTLVISGQVFLLWSLFFSSQTSLLRGKPRTPVANKNLPGPFVPVRAYLSPHFISHPPLHSSLSLSLSLLLLTWLETTWNKRNSSSLVASQVINNWRRVPLNETWIINREWRWGTSFYNISGTLDLIYSLFKGQEREWKRGKGEIKRGLLACLLTHSLTFPSPFILLSFPLSALPLIE